MPSPPNAMRSPSHAMPRLSHAAAAALLALALAGCTQTASGPVLQPPPPEGGCAAYIPQFRTQLDNDANSGNLARATYARAIQDLNQAEASCSAGREAQARLIYLSTKHTYGYPGA